MASSNAEAVQRLYDALNRGDMAGVMDCFDPEMEFHEPETLPHGGVYHGLEGMQQFLGSLTEHWEPEGIEVEELIEAGDRVIARARFRATSRATGEKVDVPLVEIVRVRDGKWVEARVYADTALMVRALGMAEATA
jgi:ketosteroid isomerase-like protein